MCKQAAGSSKQGSEQDVSTDTSTSMTCIGPWVKIQAVCKQQYQSEDRGAEERGTAVGCSARGEHNDASASVACSSYG